MTCGLTGGVASPRSEAVSRPHFLPFSGVPGGSGKKFEPCAALGFALAGFVGDFVGDDPRSTPGIFAAPHSLRRKSSSRFNSFNRSWLDMKALLYLVDAKHIVVYIYCQKNIYLSSFRTSTKSTADTHR